MMTREAHALLASKLIQQTRLHAINSEASSVYRFGPEGLEQAARDRQYRAGLVNAIRLEIAEGPKESDIELFERNGEMHVPADFFASISLDNAALTELKRYEALLCDRVAHKTQAQAETIAKNMALKRVNGELTVKLEAACRSVVMQRRLQGNRKMDYRIEYVPGRLSTFEANEPRREHAHWKIRFSPDAEQPTA